MRTLGLCLLLALAVPGCEEITADQAKEAIREFDKAFATKDVEAKQNAVYMLHDVPHDLVIKRLEKLLRNRDPRVRNVACLALGGQSHNVALAGKTLMKRYSKEYTNTEVLSAMFEAMAELKYTGYWPTIQRALKDDRSSIVIRVLDVLGAVQDWRALDLLLEMYHVAMPKRITWKTGEVKVDTGTPGDADQKAAEAKFNAKYGRGGSKEKRKAAAKAKAFDERNFATQLRKCVKRITGQDFDNAIDFEDWYVENYIMIRRKQAEMDGKDPDAAEVRAKTELPALKRKIEEERKKLEEELEKNG